MCSRIQSTVISLAPLLAPVNIAHEQASQFAHAQDIAKTGTGFGTVLYKESVMVNRRALSARSFRSLFG